MNTRKTLYISDLDGTLLNDKALLSDYTKNALNAMIAKGLHFSIATARTLVSSAKILSGVKFHIPIVLMNGVLIYDTEHQSYLQINELAPEAVTGIIKTLRQFEITGFMYKLKNGELVTYHESLEKKPLRDFVAERIANYQKSFRHTDGFEQVSPKEVIYFTLLDTYERLKPINDTIAKQPGLKVAMYEDHYNPGLWYLEIFNDKASKQNAVQYLRETYGYERIVGFGDNFNDLPMFAACDVRVAVENAKPEVKAAADYITGRNEADGVVKWMEENALFVDEAEND